MLSMRVSGFNSNVYLFQFDQSGAVSLAVGGPKLTMSALARLNTGITPQADNTQDLVTLLDKTLHHVPHSRHHPYPPLLHQHPIRSLNRHSLTHDTANGADGIRTALHGLHEQSGNERRRSSDLVEVGGELVHRLDRVRVPADSVPASKAHDELCRPEHADGVGPVVVVCALEDTFQNLRTGEDGVRRTIRRGRSGTSRGRHERERERERACEREWGGGVCVPAEKPPTACTKTSATPQTPPVRMPSARAGETLASRTCHPATLPHSQTNRGTPPQVETPARGQWLRQPRAAGRR